MLTFEFLTFNFFLLKVEDFEEIEEFDEEELELLDEEESEEEAEEDLFEELFSLIFFFFRNLSASEGFCFLSLDCFICLGFFSINSFEIFFIIVFSSPIISSLLVFKVSSTLLRFSSLDFLILY